MTVASAQNKAGPFLDTGGLAYPFSLQVFATTDIKVVRTKLVGTLYSDRVLDGTEYTVALNPNQEATPGGAVTTVASELGTFITIVRNVSPTQGTAIPNQGGFYPEVLERSLDKLTMLVQQLQADIQRSLLLSYADSNTSVDAWIERIDTTIGNAVDAAQKSANAASTSATLAQDWAIKTDGPVAGGEFSSKKHAVDSSASATLAQAWATDTSGPVGGVDLSSKAYALLAGLRADDAETARGLAVVARNEAQGFRDDARDYATQQLIATSATSLTPGAGNKNFTIQANKAFVLGMYLVATSSGTPADYMAGAVVSYDRNTGALVLAVDDFSGITARNDWVIGIAGRSSGGMTTQVVVADTACVAGITYIVAAAGLTLTLPGSWNLGDRIGIREALDEPSTYGIDFGATRVRGATFGLTLVPARRSGVDFTYQDATRGLV